MVLGKVSGDNVLGYYSMARELATLPVTKISTLVNQIAVPVMAELQSDSESMRAAFLRGLRLVASATLPLCVGLMMFADDLVRIILTDKWASAVPVLRVLCTYAFIYSVATLLASMLMARYRADLLFAYTLTQLIVMPVGFWIGAVWAGAVGVALVWATMYPLAVIWLASIALRQANIPWHSFFAEFRPAVAGTLVMVSAVLMVQLVWNYWGVDLVQVRLAITTLVGVSAYGIALLWIGGPVAVDIKEVIAWIFHRRPVVLIAR